MRSTAATQAAAQTSHLVSLINQSSGQVGAEQGAAMIAGRVSRAAESAGAHGVSLAARGTVGPGDDAAGRLTNTTARSSNDT